MIMDDITKLLILNLMIEFTITIFLFYIMSKIRLILNKFNL